MWFMKHVFNPIVRWILTSPLHAIMGKGVLLISFTGRKSGKHFTTPVEYIRAEEEVWIMVGTPEKKLWWTNLIGGAPVRLCMNGDWQTGQALALQGNGDRAEIIRGLEVFTQHYPMLKKRYGDFTRPDFDLKGIVLVKTILD
jgi:deazaflavin-dependent oxidoreductase (nitroreductase family)